MSDRAPGGPGSARLQYPGLLLRWLQLGMVAIALSGCSMRGGDIPYDVSGFGPPDRTMMDDAAYDMPLGPLDVLKINVFRVADLSGEYQVDASGNVDLPLIGSVSVSDKNPDQFAAVLEQRYSERHLNNPDISVRVMSSSNATLTVEGGVQNPGVFPLRSRTTLLGAIAMAQGVRIDQANQKRVVIFRKREGKTMAAAFDLVAIRHGEMENPVVYPGDTVVVDHSELRQLYRDLIQSVSAVAVFTSL